MGCLVSYIFPGCLVSIAVQDFMYTHFTYVISRGLANICNWVGLGDLPGSQTWFTPDISVSDWAGIERQNRDR